MSPMNPLRGIEFTVPLREWDGRDSAETMAYQLDRINALRRRCDELELENSKLRVIAHRDPSGHLGATAEL